MPIFPELIVGSRTENAFSKHCIWKGALRGFFLGAGHTTVMGDNIQLWYFRSFCSRSCKWDKEMMSEWLV